MNFKMEFITGMKDYIYDKWNEKIKNWNSVNVRIFEEKV